MPELPTASPSPSPIDAGPVVRPNAAAPAPEPAPSEQPAPEAKDAALPDELLKVPALQAVFAGQPPAVSAPIKDFQKRPEAKLIAENKDALMQAGMGLYRSLSGDLGVIFNQLRINPQQLVEADQAGKLTEVAPSFDQVGQEVSKSGLKHPVLNASAAPSAPMSAGAPSVPQAANMPAPAPASVQKSVEDKRTTSLSTNKPTSGPRPGAGRLLNSILKPVF